MSFDNSMISTAKMCFYLDIINIETNYDIINGISDFQNSKELTIYILVHNIQQGIIENIEKIISYKINENDPVIKQINRKIEEYKKDKSNIYNEYIEQLQKQIELRSRVDTNKFSNYFEHFAQFLSRIETNFEQRFKDIEKLPDEEFNLFMDLCFFMAHYDFSSIYYYDEEWNDTLKQTKEKVKDIINEQINKKNEIDTINQYKLEGNKLIIQNTDYKRKKINEYEIKNIDKYCINRVINYLSLPNDEGSFSKEKANQYGTNNFALNKIIIDEYHIEKYLKLDSLQETHINKNKEIFEPYLIKIFTSNVIKEAFTKLCENICSNAKSYKYMII